MTADSVHEPDGKRNGYQAGRDAVNWPTVIFLYLNETYYYQYFSALRRHGRITIDDLLIGRDAATWIDRARKQRHRG